MENRKPERLKALTGLRCFAAVNIVLFHFSNPEWFDYRCDLKLPFLSHPLHLALDLAPVVNAGYASVSYFILLSGFVLAYNYSWRARNNQLVKVRFWKARFARLYPIYLLSLLLSWRIVAQEWGAHTHFMFWVGMILSPLLLQGWIPSVATFLNTPAWTMSAEAFYYFIFPWVARWRRPARMGNYFVQLFVVWCLGLLPGLLYSAFHPDGIATPDRWSVGPWLQALKYTPLPHLPGFVFGVLLAELDALMERKGALRLLLGVGGFIGIFLLLELGPMIPYVIIHDGLLMPLFGCIILGLAGDNPLARTLGCRPLVFIGQASYCLYLLHFNFWNLIHDSGVLKLTGLIRFDPWGSYVILVCLALLGLYLIEKPAQRKLRQWMKV